MAFTQTATATQNFSTGYTRKDDDGYYYIDFSYIREYQGEGSPNGVITAPIGSRCTDIENGKLYINTDGSTTWVDQAA